jgi:hypothetical protein
MHTPPGTSAAGQGGLWGERGRALGAAVATATGPVWRGLAAPDTDTAVSDTAVSDTAVSDTTYLAGDSSRQTQSQIRAAPRAQGTRERRSAAISVHG